MPTWLLTPTSSPPPQDPPTSRHTHAHPPTPLCDKTQSGQLARGEFQSFVWREHTRKRCPLQIEQSSCQHTSHTAAVNTPHTQQLSTHLTHINCQHTSHTSTANTPHTQQLPTHLTHSNCQHTSHTSTANTTHTQQLPTHLTHSSCRHTSHTAA